MKTQHTGSSPDYYLSKQLTSQKMRQCVHQTTRTDSWSLFRLCPPLDQTILLTQLSMNWKPRQLLHAWLPFFPFCACPLPLSLSHTQILAYLPQLTRHNSSFHGHRDEQDKPIDQLHCILRTVVSRGKVRRAEEKEIYWQV